jgi:cob(I)alamin adenosyltransferase
VKLYTRSGDDGTTGLFGAARVGKDHPRVEAYGSVDELNALLGLAAAAVTPGSGGGGASGGGGGGGRFGEILARLQSRLFDIGADLATPQDDKHAAKIRRVQASDAAEVEGWIDEIDAANAPLKSFVLPGGTELAARLHVARAVCRRAERRVVNLSRVVEVNPQAIVYLNRVGDLLFAMARRANGAAGVPDVPWHPQR